MSDRIQCPTCRGKGHKPCGLCNGDGTIPDRRKPTPADRAVERVKEVSYTHRCESTGEFSRGYGLAMAMIIDIIREEAKHD